MAAKYEKQGITKGKYNGYHKWISRHYGKANHCSNPNCKGKSQTYEWALLKDKDYSKNVEDYIQLCKVCHAEYDELSKKLSAYKGKIPPRGPMKEGTKKKISSAIKNNYKENPNLKKTIGSSTSKGMKNLPILTCPHCGQSGVKHGMTRWHFDNCKFKPYQ